MTPSGTRISIGALSRETGCSIDTIRYYERIGLLPAVARTPGGHRQYARAHVRRLRFVRRARHLGWRLADVRRLSGDLDRGAVECGAMRSLLSAHLGDVRHRIAELRRLEADLGSLLDACAAAEHAPCGVVEAMLAGEPAQPCACGEGVD